MELPTSTRSRGGFTPASNKDAVGAMEPRPAPTWPVVGLRHSLDLTFAVGVLDGENAGRSPEALRARTAER
ncbi:hypothetical protein ACWEF9_28390 [Streptomyces sp. NPDC004980]